MDGSAERHSHYQRTQPETHSHSTGVVVESDSAREIQTAHRLITLKASRLKFQPKDSASFNRVNKSSRLPGLEALEFP